MTNRVLITEADREGFAEWLLTQPLPVTVSVRKGKHRTNRQNRLNRMWMQEISEQLGDRTPEEARAYCKLTIGVPILRAENEFFREQYDKHVRHLDYEQKLALMAEPLDMPCTRLMTTAQETAYLDEIVRHFAEMGVRLTHPDDRGR